MKHTPGPWKAIKRGADCDFIHNIIPAKGVRSIATVIDFGCLEKVNQYEQPNQEQEANAKLIAAAPDLLKLCKVAFRFFMEEMPNDKKPDYICNKMAEVLTKAEGEK